MLLILHVFFILFHFHKISIWAGEGARMYLGQKTMLPMQPPETTPVNGHDSGIGWACSPCGSKTEEVGCLQC